MTDIATILSRARHRRPSKEAIREWESGRTISYENLDDQCTALALYLQHAGLQSGDRVAIYLPNVIEFIVSQFGILRAGLVATYTNDRLAIDEAVRQLTLSDAKVVITTSERADALRAFSGMSHVPVIVASGDVAPVGMVLLSAIVSARPSGSLSFEASADSDALLRFTSGTSGEPKGALVTHRAWITRAVHLLAELVRIEEESMVLCPGPITHAAGLLILPTFLRTGTLVLLRKFDVSEIGKIAEALPIRYGMFVPTMIKMILNEASAVDRLRKSSMQQISYGGSPIPPSVLIDALDRLSPIAFVQSYGSHEAGTMSYLDEIDHRTPKLLESAGKPVLNVDIRIDPIEGQRFGELLVRTPWSSNAAVVASGKRQERDGWVRTGDLGEMRDGYLFLMERLNDVIISGSFNVYPGEVERCISSYPGIGDCVVVGAPDDKWGEKVIAYVVKESGVEISEDELGKYCRRSLAGYKVPKELIWIDEVPLNANRKPDRKRLVAERWEGRSRRIN
jgi:acyl-CoA synthetase (AMP-forming)/AMP-acid ligase II